MAGKNTAAFGIYPSRAAAEIAVDQLLSAGFSHADISVLMADNEGSRDFAAEKNTKAPEGAVTGVGVGERSGEHLGCSPALAPWLYQVWARLSRPVRSWAHSQDSVWAARSAVW